MSDMHQIYSNIIHIDVHIQILQTNVTHISSGVGARWRRNVDHCNAGLGGAQGLSLSLSLALSLLTLVSVGHKVAQEGDESGQHSNMSLAQGCGCP